MEGLIRAGSMAIGVQHTQNGTNRIGSVQTGKVGDVGMSLKYTNHICPKCNNPNYMVSLVGVSDIFQYKCINCNFYFTYDDFKKDECPYYKGVCGIDEQFTCYCQSNYKCCDIYLKHMKELIEEITPVKVIYCKDCQFYNNKVCMLHSINTDLSQYCSWAVKKGKQR